MMGGWTTRNLVSATSTSSEDRIIVHAHRDRPRPHQRRKPNQIRMGRPMGKCSFAIGLHREGGASIAPHQVVTSGDGVVISGSHRRRCPPNGYNHDPRSIRRGILHPLRGRLCSTNIEQFVSRKFKLSLLSSLYLEVWLAQYKDSAVGGNTATVTGEYDMWQPMHQRHNYASVIAGASVNSNRMGLDGDGRCFAS